MLVISSETNVYNWELKKQKKKNYLLLFSFFLKKIKYLPFHLKHEQRKIKEGKIFWKIFTPGSLDIPLVSLEQQDFSCLCPSLCLKQWFQLPLNKAKEIRVQMTVLENHFDLATSGTLIFSLFKWQTSSFTMCQALFYRRSSRMGDFRFSERRLVVNEDPAELELRS